MFFFPHWGLTMLGGYYDNPNKAGAAGIQQYTNNYHLASLTWGPSYRVGLGAGLSLKASLLGGMQVPWQDINLRHNGDFFAAQGLLGLHFSPSNPHWFFQASGSLLATQGKTFGTEDLFG